MSFGNNYDGGQDSENECNYFDGGGLDSENEVNYFDGGDHDCNEESDFIEKYIYYVQAILYVYYLCKAYEN